MRRRLVSDSYPVVVAGSGWAGLAAAVQLCEAGVPVTLIESSRQPGGRARSIRCGDQIVDNGQHLLTGACKKVLALMENVGVDINSAVLRIPFSLTQRNGTCSSLSLRTAALPAPLHLAAALIMARGLSLYERMLIFRFGHYLMQTGPDHDQDISVRTLLNDHKQTPSSIRRLWEPLCVSALNTPLTESSAQLFVNVLRESFFRSNADSDLIIPRLGLSRLFPQPAINYLEKQGAHVRLGQRVTDLDIQDNRVNAVYANGCRIPASQVVLATPHAIARRIMSPHPQLGIICENLSGLGHEPVTTLYLEYPPAITLDQPLVSLTGGTAQWIFDRSVCGQPGLMAVVISARGPHTGWTKAHLVARIVAEIAQCYPDWPEPVNTLLVREKHATYTASAAVNRLRPGNRTPVQGLWLTGDYTYSKLPATLEAAVSSGIDCARVLLSELPKKESMVY